MNKKILKAFRLILALALVIMLPMESRAASSTEESPSDKVVMDGISLTVSNGDTTSADIKIQSSHAAAERITSLQFSVKIDADANEEEPAFKFSEDLNDVAVKEYRYNSGVMTIYLSGENPLFSDSDEDVFLNVGSITLPNTASAVSIVDNSLKYVYGTSVKEQAISNDVGIAQVAVTTATNGAKLSISCGPDTKQGKGEASLYGLTGSEVTVSAPEKVNNYKFASWIDTKTGESVGNIAEYTFPLQGPISLTAVYQEAPNEDPLVTVEGGTIKQVNGIDVSSEEITNGQYKLNTVLTVEPTVPGGQQFAGWYNGEGVLISNTSPYQFYVKGDTTIEARFANEAPKPQPVVALTRKDRTEDGAGKQTVTVSISVDVPESYEVVSEGILRSYKNLTEEEMIIGASGVTKNASKTKFKKGSYTYSFAIAKNSVNKDKTVYARGYLTYTYEEDGETKTDTIYTGIVDLQRP